MDHAFTILMTQQVSTQFLELLKYFEAMLEKRHRCMIKLRMMAKVEKVWGDEMVKRLPKIIMKLLKRMTQSESLNFFTFQKKGKYAD